MPHLVHIFRFIEVISQDPDRTDSLVGACCGLLGDICTAFDLPQNLKDALASSQFVDLLAEGRRSKESKTRTLAVWASKTIRNMRKWDWPTDWVWEGKNCRFTWISISEHAHFESILKYTFSSDRVLPFLVPNTPCSLWLSIVGKRWRSFLFEAMRKLFLPIFEDLRSNFYFPEVVQMYWL